MEEQDIQYFREKLKTQSLNNKNQEQLQLMEKAYNLYKSIKIENNDQILEEWHDQETKKSLEEFLELTVEESESWISNH